MSILAPAPRHVKPAREFGAGILPVEPSQPAPAVGPLADVLALLERLGYGPARRAKVAAMYRLDPAAVATSVHVGPIDRAAVRAILERPAPTTQSPDLPTHTRLDEVWNHGYELGMDLERPTPAPSWYSADERGAFEQGQVDASTRLDARLAEMADDSFVAELAESGAYAW